MTCNLTRPAPQVLWDRTANMFSANVLGGAPIIANSTEQYVVGSDFLAAQTFYSIAEQQWRETDPREACCDNLVKIAASRGVYPRPAQYARGYVILTGTAGALLSPSMQFAIGGNNYNTDTAVTVPAALDANGTATVRVIAVAPGLGANALATSVTAKLLTPLINVNAIVTPCGAQFCGGRDAETCEQFRTRYLARAAYKPAGRWADLQLILAEYPCLTRVCMRTCNCCTEQYRFELFAFFDTSFAHGIPPDTVLSDLQEWFFGATQGMGLGAAPIGTFGRFYQQSAATVDVTIDGLQCIRSDQLQLVKTRIAELFTRLCPGDTLKLRLFELVIAQIVGADVDFNVFLASSNPALIVTPCGDAQPDCDTVPVLATILILTSVC